MAAAPTSGHQGQSDHNKYKISKMYLSTMRYSNFFQCIYNYSSLMILCAMSKTDYKKDLKERNENKDE